MSFRYKAGFIQEFFNPLSADTVSYNLYSWGYNNYGQLGQNDLVARSSPVQVGSGTTWLNLAGGYYHVLSTKTDGSLWSWGRNANGYLGLGDLINRSSPVQVGSLTNWSKISANITISASIKTDGTLWTWGRNNQGQLGQNIAYTTDRSSPVQVGSLTTWSYIGCGGDFMAATKTDGTLWTWGNNQYGQLGQNIVYSTDRSSPVQVGSGATWLYPSVGYSHGTAIKTDGTIWSWGRNALGSLGQNISYLINRSSPVQIGALTTWANIYSGNWSVFAIKTDGTLWSWGENNNGQLGQNDRVYRSSPVQVGSLTNWSVVSCRRTVALATKTDGTLWSWGLNSSGQLGQNDIVSRSSPVQIGSKTNWSKIATNVNASFAITESNP